ncbi:putative nucleotide-binding alpha-beta plait domain superfamily, RNA-binding domain superfamily [Helianthus anomalus]
MANGRPADRDGRGSGSSTYDRKEKGTKGITKFYVERLPERCSSKDISKALWSFGKIKRVCIARKRDKNGFHFSF